MDKWRWDDIRWLHHQGDNHQEKDDESFDFSVGGLQVEQFSGQFKDEKKIIMWKCWNRRRCPTSLYLFTSWLVHLQVVKMWIVMIRVLLDSWFWCNPGSWFVIPLFLSLIWCLTLNNFKVLGKVILEINVDNKSCVMKVTLAVVSLTCILKQVALPSLFVFCHSNLQQAALPSLLSSSSATRACIGRLSPWSQRLVHQQESKQDSLERFSALPVLPVLPVLCHIWVPHDIFKLSHIQIAVV